MQQDTSVTPSSDTEMKQKERISALIQKRQLRRRQIEIVFGSISLNQRRWLENWRGIALFTTTPKQHVHKVNKEQFFMVSAKSAGDKAAARAARSVEQKQQYPSNALCYLISFHAPSSSGCQD